MLATAKFYINSIFKIYTWDKINTNFIVSSGRTGTNYLADFFANNFDNVYSVHEPGPEIYSIGREFIRNNLSLNDASNRILKNRMSSCIRLNKLGTRNYIESNPSASLNLPIINKAFPNCKVVWIIRNGKDWARSSYSKFNAGNNHSYIFDKHEPIDRLTAEDFKDDVYFNEWENFERFERICWNWLKYNELIEEFARNSNNVLFVKYEDIFNKDAGYPGLFEIIDYLKLNSNFKLNKQDVYFQMERKTNANETYLLPKKFNDWKPHFQEAFVNICGDSMKKYNYAL